MQNLQIDIRKEAPALYVQIHCSIKLHRSDVVRFFNYMPLIIDIILHCQWILVPWLYFRVIACYQKFSAVGLTHVTWCRYGIIENFSSSTCFWRYVAIIANTYRVNVRLSGEHVLVSLSLSKSTISLHQLFTMEFWDDFGEEKFPLPFCVSLHQATYTD